MTKAAIVAAAVITAASMPMANLRQKPPTRLRMGLSFMARCVVDIVNVPDGTMQTFLECSIKYSRNISECNFTELSEIAGVILHSINGGIPMKTFPTLLFAGALMVAVPFAMADDLVISPEIGVHFHDTVKTKKYKSHKWDGDAKIGVIVDEDVEYYDMPDEVIVATPALKSHRYVYLNDEIYIVDSDRRIVAIVE